MTWSNSSAIFGGSFQRHVRIFWTRPLIGAHCSNTSHILHHFTTSVTSQPLQYCNNIWFGTSSSAVAKRLRDASCLSVVSFNSTKRQVESFTVSYVGYRFITASVCVQLTALFCCLWRNVEASFHKHFIIISSYQHRRLLPAMCHTQLAGRWPWSTGDRVDNTWLVAALTAGS